MNSPEMPFPGMEPPPGELLSAPLLGAPIKGSDCITMLAGFSQEGPGKGTEAKSCLWKHEA